MKAPKHRTNMPSCKLSTWLPPYLEEWTRAEAARLYPDAEGHYSRGAVSRYLRGLVEAAKEVAEE